jgi:hypothetical protein
MADSKTSRQNEVQVEDLLRLKRAERPDAAFWDTFDRQLHQRMLQTLVKKDPWYAQVLRGATGRIAQTTAVGAAAAFLALLVVRPAFIDSLQATPGALSESSESAPLAQNADQPTSSHVAPVEVAMADFDDSLTADYRIESMSSTSIADASSVQKFTQEYAHDSIEVSNFDREAYVMDTASSFAVSGVTIGLGY